MCHFSNLPRGEFLWAPCGLTYSDVGGIKEGAMASSEMLVAQGRRLGGLTARVVGSSSGIQIHNDGLPPGPNASRA